MKIIREITVLSFGAGQDSTYILYKIIRDKQYRERIVKGHFIVVISDTGNEHTYTYEHIKFIKKLCKENKIEFYFLTADKGFHPKTWPSLTSQLEKNNTIMSMMFPRSCTDNLKIKPFYNFLNVYIANKFYNTKLPNSTRNKKYVKLFASYNNRINVILGIAAGEETRVKVSKTKLKDRQLDLFKAPKRPQIIWMNKCINKLYPMIVDGIDRTKAQQYILATPWPLPPPSNCMMCPFMTKPEILWMYRFIPDDFHKWVELEQNKINKNLGIERNLGVKGEKLLTEILKEAIQEFGHWSDEQLQEHKMSHGHCVLSSF